MSRPRPPSRPKDEPFVNGDPIPVPDAREDNSDTSWALWNALNEPPDPNFPPTEPAAIPMPQVRDDPRYAKTEPAPLRAAAPPEAPRPAPPSPKVAMAEVMAEIRRKNRVCPQPPAWQKLYEMLPGKRQVEGGWEPPPPLIGSAWSTPSLTKRACLRRHIEWAESQGVLDEIHRYLKGLPEASWHHMGD